MGKRLIGLRASGSARNIVGSHSMPEFANLEGVLDGLTCIGQIAEAAQQVHSSLRCCKDASASPLSSVACQVSGRHHEAGAVLDLGGIDY
jgi:hypothetical protein